jgi:carboxylesterase
MTTKDHSYRIDGGPVGVLLIHGLCGSPTEMRYIANGLARQGYTVHCPQLAGHCDGYRALSASTWRDWYNSAEQAFTDLEQSCDTVVVGGLSTGALLAMMLAHRFARRISGLALFSPTLWLTGRQVPWYAKFFNLVTTKTVARLIDFPAPHQFGIKDPRLRDVISKALKAPGNAQGTVKTPGSAVLERRWLVRQVTKLTRFISQPTLIIHPREDDYAGLDNAFYLQEYLPGSVEMVVLDDSYHIVTVDRQRDVVLERTRAFIGRLVGNSEGSAAPNAAADEKKAA